MDSNGDPVDADFYRSFWGLQSTFQAPYDAMVPAAWSSAVKTIQAALKRFKQEGVAAAGGGLPAAGAYALCRDSSRPHVLADATLDAYGATRTAAFLSPYLRSARPDISVHFVLFEESATRSSAKCCSRAHSDLATPQCAPLALCRRHRWIASRCEVPQQQQALEVAAAGRRPAAPLPAAGPHFPARRAPHGQAAAEGSCPRVERPPGASVCTNSNVILPRSCPDTPIGTGASPLLGRAL